MRKNVCWMVLVLLTLTCFLNLTIFSLFCTPNSQQLRGNEGVSDITFKQLVILVMTAPQNYERRQVIRETWLSKLAAEKAQVYFVLGTKNVDKDRFSRIAKEQHINNDIIILEDLEDSYFKLTEKLLEALAITSTKHNSTYILKCDDDTYIDSVKLLAKLDTLPSSKLYWGYFTGAARVKKTGQWAEPNFHLCDRYLPYARGGGYVITRDIVEYIINNRAMLQMYNSEDVTMGVWLAPLAIQRLHDTGFDTEATSRGCSNHHIVSHKQTVEDMKSKFDSLELQGRLCKQEMRLAAEYRYDWNVVPSQCCKPNIK